MANVCSNFVTIAGERKKLNELRKRIYKQDHTLVADDGLFTWFEVGLDYGLVQELSDFANPTNCLRLDFTSKWAPPDKELANLARAYPSLDFEIVFEEPGNSVYGVLRYSHGRNSLNVNYTEEEYLEKYSEEYRDAVDDIKESKYEDFTKEFITEGGIDTIEEDHFDLRLTPYLEKHILARVKDKDLALLVGHEWEDGSNQKAFETRLKGAVSCASSSRKRPSGK